MIKVNCAREMESAFAEKESGMNRPILYLRVVLGRGCSDGGAGCGSVQPVLRNLKAAVGRPDHDRKHA